eukprot:6187583-Pleurochrysis_carterae.AAC.6
MCGALPTADGRRSARRSTRCPSRGIVDASSRAVEKRHLHEHATASRLKRPIGRGRPQKLRVPNVQGHEAKNARLQARVGLCDGIVREEERVLSARSRDAERLSTGAYVWSVWLCVCVCVFVRACVCGARLSTGAEVATARPGGMRPLQPCVSKRFRLYTPKDFDYILAHLLRVCHWAQVPLQLSPDAKTLSLANSLRSRSIVNRCKRVGAPGSLFGRQRARAVAGQGKPEYTR